MLLKDALPDFFFDCSEEFPDVMRHYNDEVVGVMDSSEDSFPGNFRNVHVWWKLANGYAVGMNENPAKGITFPVVRIKQRCEYCHESKSLLKTERISRAAWGFGYDGTKISLEEAESDMDKFDVFVDRGFLRFADITDSDCMDHGDKIAISYCPMCGRKLN